MLTSIATVIYCAAIICFFGGWTLFAFGVLTWAFARRDRRAAEAMRNKERARRHYERKENV